VVNLESTSVAGTRDPVDAFRRETMQLGGRVLATWTEGALFASAESHGLRHLFGWSHGLGAEHHAVVPFAVHSSAFLARDGEGSRWYARDAKLEKWLRSHAALSEVGARLSFPRLEGVAPDAWFLQIRPLEGGRGHLVLRPGDGATGEFLDLVEHLRPHLAGTDAREAPFVIPPAYGVVAARTLNTLRTSSTPPPPPPPASGSERATMTDAEYTCRVSVALNFFASGRYRESISMWKAIARDAADRERRWRALQQVGCGYDALEDYERAVHFFQLALAEGAPLAEIEGDLARSRHRIS
jgi:hypothetical protein